MTTAIEAVTQLQAEADELKSVIEGLEKGRIVLRDEVARLEERLDAERKRLRGERDLSREHFAQAMGDLDEMREERDALKLEVRDLVDRLDRARSANCHNYDAAEQYQAANDRNYEVGSQWKAEAERLEIRVEKGLELYRELEKERDALNAEAFKMNDKIRDLTEELEEAKAEIGRLAVRCREAVAVKDAEIARLKADLDEEKSEHQATIQMYRSHREQLEKTQAYAKELKTRLSGDKPRGNWPFPERTPEEIAAYKARGHHDLSDQAYATRLAEHGPEAGYKLDTSV